MRAPNDGRAPRRILHRLRRARFQAITALLTGRFRITRREVCEVMAELFGETDEISLGTVAVLERRTSRALRPAYDQALDVIQNADFVNCDGTS